MLKSDLTYVFKRAARVLSILVLLAVLGTMIQAGGRAFDAGNDGLFFMPGKDGQFLVPGAEEVSAAAKLKRFKSRKAVKKYVKKVKKKEEARYKIWRKKFVRPEMSIVYDGDMPNVPMYEAAAKASSGSSGGSDHSDTYTQVEGVDEADRIKTDGKYVYNLGYSGSDAEIQIHKISGSNVKRVSRVQYKSTGEYSGSIEEFFLSGDRLIVIGSLTTGPGRYVTKSGSASWKPYQFTTVRVYDIKDRTRPKKVSEYSQSGYLVSSRMIGKHVYLVTDDYIRDWKDYYIPCTMVKGKIKRISPKKITAFPGSVSANYAVIGAFDTKTGKGEKIKAKTRAVFGASQDIYCSTKNLYLAESVRGYAFDTLTQDADSDIGISGKTMILKVGISGSKIKFKAKGEVKGVINNQFSMDEDGSYFRVATTATEGGKDVNYVFVLNGKMKTVGKTGAFGEDEHIEAVRFLGDTGYVITYEETDPLFVLDLSKPKEPKITGSVKITGFSTLLHPVSKTRLLGVGYATGDGGDIGMEVQEGVKLALFSVKNKKDPKVLDSASFRDIYSEAQYDHRAFLVNKKKKYYAIPLESYDMKGGVLCFKISGDKIKTIKRFTCNSDIVRCVAAGNYIYAADYEGELYPFKV